MGESSPMSGQRRAATAPVDQGQPPNGRGVGSDGAPPGCDTDEDLLRDLQDALGELDAGQVVEHVEAMGRIRSMFEGHVSAAELEAFDRA